jgi:peroxiredoxin
MRSALVLFGIGILVGLLAWQERLTSMMGLAPTLAAVCVVVGLLSLSQRPRDNLWIRSLLIMAGAGSAFAGGIAQHEMVDQGRIAAQTAAITALVGRPAPTLTGLVPANVDRAELRAATSFRNQVTIVTFWTRWCSGCRRELRELNDLYMRHQSDGLVVVGVTEFDSSDESKRDEQVAAARRYAGRLGLNFPVAIARDSSTQADYHVHALPSAALIDRKGVLVDYGVGVTGGREIIESAEILLGR